MQARKKKGREEMNRRAGLIAILGRIDAAWMKMAVKTSATLGLGAASGFAWSGNRLLSSVLFAACMFIGMGAMERNEE